MVRALFTTTSTIHHLKHRVTFLSVPDFVLASPSARIHIDPLLSHAGIAGFQSRRWDQDRAALLGLYQLQHCYGIDVNETHQMPDLECEKYNGRPIHTSLSVQLEENYFGLRQMYRDDGLILTSENSTESHFDRGTNSIISAHDPDEYWNFIKSRISHSSRFNDDHIDLLILHGTQVTRPDFLYLVREVFANNDKIKEEEYLRSAEEHAYAAAVGVAQLAKVGMWTDFEHCIPRYGCPVSEHTPEEFRWHRADDKGEL